MGQPAAPHRGALRNAGLRPAATPERSRSEIIFENHSRAGSDYSLAPERSNQRCVLEEVHWSYAAFEGMSVTVSGGQYSPRWGGRARKRSWSSRSAGAWKRSWIL